MPQHLNRKTRVDILDDMTKDEIIHFVRRKMYLRLPSKRDLWMLRWENKVQQLEKEESEARERFASFDFSQRDRIAQQCNLETDVTKKIELLQQLASYQEIIDNYFAECKSFEKRHAALTRLFNKAQRSK